MVKVGRPPWAGSEHALKNAEEAMDDARSSTLFSLTWLEPDARLLAMIPMHDTAEVGDVAEPMTTVSDLSE